MSKNMQMTFEEVIELLKVEYERARGLKYIRNPLAFALYEVWQRVDKKTRRKGGAK